MKLYKKSERIPNNIISASQKSLKKPCQTHWHDFFELEFFLDGDGEYMVDGKTHPIKKNMLIFLTPANFHYMQSENSEMINIMFSGEYLDNKVLFSVLFHNNSVINLEEKDADLIKKMLFEVVEFSNSNKPLYAIQFLNCTLAKLASLQESQENISHSYIQSAILYILENFRLNISLKEVSDYVGLSSSYLSDLFVKQTGKNFKTYLDNFRFDYAKKLLKFSDMTIYHICYKSGFNDYANFTRRFKKLFTKTPIEYRKEIQN